MPVQRSSSSVPQSSVGSTPPATPASNPGPGPGPYGAHAGAQTTGHADGQASGQTSDRAPRQAGATSSVRGLSWLSTALAFILVLEIAGLSLYAWSFLQRETDPERLAERAERALEAHYPQLRSQFLRQVDQQAPLLASRVSDELIEASPTARLELENLSVEFLERGLDDAVELSADEFREWLQQNHAVIEDAFEQIGQAPHDARLLMLDTEASLEEQLGVDLRDQARLALEVYRMLNDKLARLSDPNTPLSEQERLERRAVRLLRALAR